MKKNVMLVAGLLGALSFSACVEDNESELVSAIRQAKAKQLESVAALYNAQASTEEALRESKAAIAAAQARQEAALAEIKAAEARQEAAEAESAEANSKADQKEAEQRVAVAQAEMERIAIQLQVDLADKQVELLQAQADLQKKATGLAEEQMTKLNELSKDYSGALTTYATLQGQVVDQEVSLAALKADLADWEVLKAEEIAEKEYEIELNKKTIEALKQYTNYSEDVQSLQLQLEDAKNARDIAQDAYNNLANIYKGMDDEFKADWNDVKDELMTDIKANELYLWIKGWSSHDFSYIDNDGNYRYIDVDEYQPGKITENGFIIYSDNGEYPPYTVSAFDSLNFELRYKDVRQLKVDVDNAIAAQDVAGKKTTVETATKDYAAAQKATIDAKAAWDKDPKNATLKSAYETALYDELSAKNYLESVQNDLEKAEETVADFNTTYALVSDTKLGDELAKLVDEYNAAVVAVYKELAAAYFAYQAAQEVYDEAVINCNVMSAVVEGSTNRVWGYVSIYNLVFGSSDLISDDATINSRPWFSDDVLDVLSSSWIEYYTTTSDIMGAIQIDVAIKACESYIEFCEGEIERLKSTTTQEQQIAYAEAQLEGLNAKVLAAKVQVDTYKAQLDALMEEYAAEDGTTEDTTTETPAA